MEAWYFDEGKYLFDQVFKKNNRKISYALVIVNKVSVMLSCMPVYLRMN